LVKSSWQAGFETCSSAKAPLSVLTIAVVVTMHYQPIGGDGGN